MDMSQYWQLSFCINKYLHLHSLGYTSQYHLAPTPCQFTSHAYRLPKLQYPASKLVFLFLSLSLAPLQSQLYKFPSSPFHSSTHLLFTCERFPPCSFSKNHHFWQVYFLFPGNIATSFRRWQHVGLTSNQSQCLTYTAAPCQPA